MTEQDPTGNPSESDWTPWSKYVLIEIQRLSKDQSTMNSLLHENTASLKEHMAQTAAVKDLALSAHKRAELLEISIDNHSKAIEKKIEPIQTHIKLVSLIFKWVLPPGLLMALPAAIYYTLKLFGKI